MTIGWVGATCTLTCGLCDAWGDIVLVCVTEEAGTITVGTKTGCDAGMPEAGPPFP